MLTDLERHGQWKSDSIAEGYIANSRPLRLHKMNLLQPKAKRREKEEPEQVAENAQTQEIHLKDLSAHEHPTALATVGNQVNLKDKTNYPEKKK